MKKHLQVDLFCFTFVSVKDVCASMANFDRVFSHAGITIGKPKDKRTLVGGLFNLCEYENMNNILGSDKSNSLLKTKLCGQHWFRHRKIEKVFIGLFSFSSFSFFNTCFVPSFSF